MNNKTIKIAKEKDNGTFAKYGMKQYLSICSGIFPYRNTECINYIVETYLECIDDISFDEWLKKGNKDGRPIIITKKMLEEDFKDLLIVSDDLNFISDLFMYLYDIDMWIDEEIGCLYTTMFHISYANRKKLNYIGIAMEFERLCVLHEKETLLWSDIDSIVEYLFEYGYDIERDYKYRTNDVYETAYIIEERLNQIFGL